MKCSTCKVTLSRKNACWKNKKARKLHNRCNPCMRKYTKKHYEKHKQEYIRRTLETKAKTMQKRFDYLRDKECIDCGEKDPIVLQFDHRDPSKKKFTAAELWSSGKKWSNILKELKKCDIRCSNCHIRKTAKQFGWYKKINISVG